MVLLEASLLDDGVPQRLGVGSGALERRNLRLVVVADAEDYGPSIGDRQRCRVVGAAAVTEGSAWPGGSAAGGDAGSGDAAGVAAGAIDVFA